MPGGMAIFLSREQMMEEKKQHLLVDDTLYETEVPERYIRKAKKETAVPGYMRAVIPGVIVDIKVQKGQKIISGDVVIVLEAMKMYNDIEAETDGTIAEVMVSKGDKVAKGQIMIRLV